MLLTILGVIIGGFITLFVTHIQLQNQEKHRREERKVKTYEEIHKHLSTLCHQAGLCFIEIAGKVQKNFPPDDRGKVVLPWQELEMLVNFYTPELKDDFKIIKKNWNQLGRAWSLILADKYTQEETPDKLLEQSKQLVEQIEVQVNVAKNKLSNLANKIV